MLSNDHLLIETDARDLSMLPDQYVQTVVTSPPYFGLRDYGHGEQIGLEPTPEEYVAALVAVFQEVRRVLKDDGTVWLNLGDSYAAHKGQRKVTDKAGPKQMSKRGSTGCPSRFVAGLKAKDLIGIPWMVAFALRTDGWYLRSDIIWNKPNPMPESTTDRPTRAHEYLFLLTKQSKYYYDKDAIAEPVVKVGTPAHLAGGSGVRAGTQGGLRRKNEASGDRTKVGFNDRWDAATEPKLTRNKRSVWLVTPQPYSGAHFAVMPEKLVEPCVLGGSRPGDTVLDPFCGSGTVGVVCKRLGRDFIGTDLNPAYLALAETRITDAA
jgi:DNA modification methylase